VGGVHYRQAQIFEQFSAVHQVGQAALHLI
jgi:hypothetical protein